MTKVAAIHTGWRGLSQGILEVALKEFVGLELVAWVGPCISANFYEVGSDVYDKFIEQHQTFGQAFRSKSKDKYLFDMKLVARQILNDSHYFDIVDSGLCTYSNKIVIKDSTLIVKMVSQADKLHLYGLSKF